MNFNMGLSEGMYFNPKMSFAPPQENKKKKTNALASPISEQPSNIEIDQGDTSLPLQSEVKPFDPSNPITKYAAPVLGGVLKAFNVDNIVHRLVTLGQGRTESDAEKAIFGSYEMSAYRIPHPKFQGMNTTTSVSQQNVMKDMTLREEQAYKTKKAEFETMYPSVGYMPTPSSTSDKIRGLAATPIEMAKAVLSPIQILPGLGASIKSGLLSGAEKLDSMLPANLSPMMNPIYSKLNATNFQPTIGIAMSLLGSLNDKLKYNMKKPAIPDTLNVAAKPKNVGMGMGMTVR